MQQCVLYLLHTVCLCVAISLTKEWCYIIEVLNFPFRSWKQRFSFKIQMLLIIWPLRFILTPVKDFPPSGWQTLKHTSESAKGKDTFTLTLEFSIGCPGAIFWSGWSWKWRVGFKCFVKRAICFWFLAGGAAEVQARLHQPFPGQAARAGAKDAGEEAAGGLGKPSVRRCSPAEESPQCPVYLSQRYRASSHPHLPHALCCTLSPCSCSGRLPHDQSHIYRHRTNSKEGGF